MYIYRIIYVYMSNNCVYVTGIHMNLYIWRARFEEGGERQVREGREWTEANCICIFITYLYIYVYN